MKKSTFKKGGILLLAALATAGSTFALMAPTASGIRAKWYDTRAKFDTPIKGGSDMNFSMTEDLAKKTAKADISKHAPVVGMEYSNYYSVLDFSKMKDAKLINGVFVTFENQEEITQLPFEGVHSKLTYDEVQNHEMINTAHTFTVTDQDGQAALGVYQNTKSKAKVEFLYSTKGLMGVEGLDVDLIAMGNTKFVNRKIDWGYMVITRDLDGSNAKVVVDHKPIFTACNHQIGNKHGWKNLVRVSDAGAIQQGELDNKIIHVMFYSNQSVPDEELASTVDKAKDTEPLTVFRDARIAFNRPDIEFDASKKAFEAGAGRYDCAFGQLTVDVAYWNSLYINNYTKTNNVYTKKFQSQDREKLWSIDDAAAPQEELAYFEISVKYPFTIETMTVSDEKTTLNPYTDYEYADAKKTKLDRYDIEELAYNDEIGKEYDKKTGITTYRIPREYFKQMDAKDDRDCKSQVVFEYSFRPLEVAEFPEAEYIWLQTSAEATDKDAIVLSGTSIPEYSDEMEIHFTNYKEYKVGDPITFKRLPEFGIPGEDLKGGFTLANLTPAENDATDRYNDDVQHIGWKITYNVLDSKGNVAKQKETYSIGQVLPQEVFGFALPDFLTWLDQLCPGCEAPKMPIKGSFHLGNVIDCRGNIAKNIVSIEPIFRHSRGDVNVDDDASKYVKEHFSLDPKMVYVSPKDKKYNYTGRDLMDGKNGAVYEGDIFILGTSTFIWYNFEDKDLLAHGMGIVTPILKNVEEKSRVDVFFSPYDETSAVQYESRPHTVHVKATGLRPDKEGGKIATLKVFKEQFSHNESTDDRLYHTNAFLFTAGQREASRAYWLSNNISNPTKTMAVDWKGIYGKWRGTDTTDTLYFEIDLDDDALVQRIKEEGLELEVVYMPKNDRNEKAIFWDIIQGCLPGLPNVMDHIAQFGIATNNWNTGDLHTPMGFNEFYVVGTTDCGLITTMNADHHDGSYNSFYRFILRQFNVIENYPVPELRPTSIKGIYEEVFKKDYMTRYVGTCYPKRASQFIISGINIKDPVDMARFTNKKDAFKYTFTEIADLEGTVYSKIVKTKDGEWQVLPNKYGEVLVGVNVAFDPADRDNIPMTIDTITSGSKKLMWARYYAKDQIRLAPQQRSNEPANRVRFYDLNDYRANLSVDDDLWLTAGIFAPFFRYGVNINDTLTANIKGDIKVPEVWFSSDEAGKNKITSFKFGEVAGGASETQPVYIQGRDLPHMGTTSMDYEDKIEQTIRLTTTDMFSVKTKEFSVYDNTLALAMDCEANPYEVKLGKDGALLNNVLRGDVVIELPVTATPNIKDLCETEGTLSLEAVCDVTKDLALEFTAALKEPTIKEPQPGELGGSDAKINWTAVPGAHFYRVAVGHFQPKYTSEDVFMSEVFADDANKKIWIELFNATGDVIHRDNVVNYWLEITKTKAGKSTKTTVKLNNTNLQGGTQPEDRFRWAYEPKAVSIDDVELTTDVKNPVKYVIRLMLGAEQIDIYQFDTPSSWMVRKPVSPMPINAGEFNTGEWSTEIGSLPAAYYAWQDNINFEGEESYDVASTATSISIHNLLPQSAYTVRVQAYNFCVGQNGEMVPSQDFKDITTGKTPTTSGDIFFDGATDVTGNEDVEVAGVKVIATEGQVVVLGAAGKKVTLTNLLGQTISTTVATSDNASIAAPAGVVVVNVEGETPVKALVK